MKPWQREEIEFFKTNYRLTSKNLAKTLHRTVPAIQHKRSRLRILKRSTPIPWPQEHDKYLVENYGTSTISDIARNLKRSWGSVQARIKRLKLNLQPVKIELTETELAYIAGIIDGEGCIYFPKPKRTSLRISLQISNTDKNLMDWLHTKLYFRRRSRKVYEFNNPHYPKNKMIYSIAIQDPLQLKPLLTALLPYLIVKKQKAIKALKICVNRGF